MAKLPKSFTTVTPFSKALALSILIIFPILGFYLGRWYQQTIIVGASLSQTATVVPTVLLVTRLEDTTDHLPFFTKIITDTQKVKQLYDDVSNLSDPSHGTNNCPASYFETYSLDFYQDKKPVLHVVLSPTGCSFIQLDSGTRKDAMDNKGDTFISDLQHTLGLSYKEFYGYQDEK